MNRIDLKIGEEPVLANFLGDDLWALLTNQRLFWRLGNDVESLSPDQIESVSIPRRHLLQAGSKLGTNHLLVQYRGGGEIELQLEAGKPFFGFWNALRALAAAASAQTSTE